MPLLSIRVNLPKTAKNCTSTRGLTGPPGACRPRRPPGWCPPGRWRPSVSDPPRRPTMPGTSRSTRCLGGKSGESTGKSGKSMGKFWGSHGKSGETTGSFFDQKTMESNGLVWKMLTGNNGFDPQTSSCSGTMIMLSHQASAIYESGTWLGFCEHARIQQSQVSKQLKRGSNTLKPARGRSFSHWEQGGKKHRSLSPDDSWEYLWSASKLQGTASLWNHPKSIGNSAGRTPWRWFKKGRWRKIQRSAKL